MRKPVAILDDNGGLIVVCDDGTVWQLISQEWHRFSPPIPGTLADEQSQLP
jgi:hypothetical protein